MNTFPDTPIETQLYINGELLVYYDENHYMYKYGPITEEGAREIFYHTKKFFDEAGVKFAVVFGSLLGAVRENGHLIKGDADVDICTWEEEKLRDNLINFYNKGLKVIRIFPGYFYSFRVNMDCYIDVYIMKDIDGIFTSLWRLYCLSLGGEFMPKKFFTGWQEIEFLGEKCLCPENPERLLEFWYGPDWRIPQSKKGNYSVKSFTIYCKFIKKMKKVVWFLSLPFRFTKVIFNREYRKKILQRKKETGSFFFK